MAIISPLPRPESPERQCIHKLIHTTRDKDHARRLMAILLPHEVRTVLDVHLATGTSRSTIGRWFSWYRESGLEGLKFLPAGRPMTLPMAQITALLSLLVQFSPKDFGYQRSRWCTELLAIQINALLGTAVAASTIRRWLPRVGIVWRRPAPTLQIKDPDYQDKIALITQALTQCSQEHPVFYEDEVDIELNPKLGADWMPRGQQKKVVTPGAVMLSTIWPAPCTPPPGKCVMFQAARRTRSCSLPCWRSSGATTEAPKPSP